MIRRILQITFFVHLMILTVFSQTPEEMCQSDGQSVCINCVTSGTCVETNGNFDVTDTKNCPTNTFCDDTNTVRNPPGLCFNYAGYEDSISCDCDGTDLCPQDPNNEDFYNSCSGTDFVCISNDGSSCQCLDASTTPTSSSSETTTSSSSETTTSSSSETTTSSSETTTSSSSETTTSSSSETTSSSSETTTSSSEATTSSSSETTSSSSITTSSTSSEEESTTTTTTGIPLTCPPDCIFVDDPNDDCEKYYYCSDNGNIPAECPPGFCFYQDFCQCYPTPTTCPPDCPLLDDPNDNCSKYYFCTNGDFIPYECQSQYCFDQESCGCVSSVTSTTTELTTTVPPSAATTTITPTKSQPSTCPPGCPFVENPSAGDCSDFYVCNGGDLLPATCPTHSCFDQDFCGCVS